MEEQLKELRLNHNFQSNYSLLIYGMPKIGLTELAGQFPKPIVFFNLKDDPAKIDGTVLRIPDWLTFLQTASDVNNEKTKYKTVILAHLEDLWQYICDFVTQTANDKNGTSAANISELSFSEWRQAIQLFEEKVKKFMTLGNTIILSHELTENRNVRGNERTHYLLNLEKKAQLVALNLVQAVGRLFMTEADLRVLSFCPAENQITGSRIPELLDRKFIIHKDEPPEFIELLNQRPKIAMSA